MTCEDCRHYEHCYERRGRCREYETQEMKNRRIADEIRQINENFKESAEGPGANTTGKSGD